MVSASSGLTFPVSARVMTEPGMYRVTISWLSSFSGLSRLQETEDSTERSTAMEMMICLPVRFTVKNAILLSAASPATISFP